MSALDCLGRLANTNVVFADLRYCLVNEAKVPFKIDGSPARTNIVDDFVDFETLLECPTLDEYAGVGISIQASKICAIDIDKCFARENDVSSADERAKFVLDLFKDVAYCEFSFSGRGLRVLFKRELIEDYNKTYYIKNKTFDIEYYQPSNSNRYVTLTGNTIFDNSVDNTPELDESLFAILNKYMRRQQRVRSETHTTSTETRSFDELRKLVRIHWFTNTRFQDIWFSKAPGSGKDESERDFYLLSYLYENITQDKDLLKQLFESSDFFKSKDTHHVYKWKQQDHRYFNFLYDNIRSSHQ